MTPLARICMAAFSLLASCHSMLPGAASTGDEPRMNRSTSKTVKDVPFCSGGDRGKLCAFGSNCRVTEAGCQVCQCLNPE